MNRRSEVSAASSDRSGSRGGRAVRTPLRLIAFDLDDTLAPSKSPIDAHMAHLLASLSSRVDVAIISGGHLDQFTAQVVDRLPALPGELLSRFHLLPTCGTQYYRLGVSGVRQVYALSLTQEQRSRAIAAVEDQARALGLWEERVWGDIIEDRGSQITFSALGQHAPVAAKSRWDPSGSKRDGLRSTLARHLPDLEVRSGGSTSIDITDRGVDKAFGMRRLAEQTGIPLDAMLFVGDRLDEHGNDYPVRAMGVTCHPVHTWQDTVAYLERLIPTLTPRA